MKSILAIDDDKSTLDILKAQLTNLGYRAFIELDPEKGIQTALTFHPDLILLDLNLTQMIGIEVLRQLRKKDITKNIPVIMLTAIKKKESVVEAMRYGIIDYMVKPHSIERLHGKIESAIMYGNMKHEESLSKSNLIDVLIDQTTAVIEFKEKPGKKEFLEEAKVTFNKFFFAQIAKRKCVIDLRAIQEIDVIDIKIMERIVALFKERDLYIVAGKHYGKMIEKSSIEDAAQMFISSGDLELYLKAFQ
jgi:DNA-binding response OmpR family regulator